MPYKPKTFRMVDAEPRKAAKDYDKRREQDKPWRKWYRLKRWMDARTSFLARHPLCVECHKTGMVTVATDVDHITPHRGNYELFWDVHNWQALCHTHHSRKTRRGE